MTANYYAPTDEGWEKAQEAFRNGSEPLGDYKYVSALNSPIVVDRDLHLPAPLTDSNVTNVPTLKQRNYSKKLRELVDGKVGFVVLVIWNRQACTNGLGVVGPRPSRAARSGP